MSFRATLPECTPSVEEGRHVWHTHVYLSSAAGGIWNGSWQWFGSGRLVKPGSQVVALPTQVAAEVRGLVQAVLCERGRTCPLRRPRRDTASDCLPRGSRLEVFRPGLVPSLDP